jgi:hypothetical protein
MGSGKDTGIRQSRKTRSIGHSRKQTRNRNSLLANPIQTGRTEVITKSNPLRAVDQCTNNHLGVFNFSVMQNHPAAQPGQSRSVQQNSRLQWDAAGSLAQSLADCEGTIAC